MLAQEPRILKKLREEIDNLCDNDMPLTVEMTKNLPYLNAVVNEALRLYNPISGVQATTSPSGVTETKEETTRGSLDSLVLTKI